ncbi:MAG: hypothetical protein A3J29_13025 [Acidobacteria bacterium RIFCSPLOWO2_12_FULL_67_14b]|nr:MAG: hypothetical protein A3J29_13025 [Acidobacteria bacterium RIFCSPLOWO2_12_FULL_67_14b]
MRRTAAILIAASLVSSASAAQEAPNRVLFRVFLSDGRVLASYGEWARLENRVIFSIPTQMSRDPVELHLVSIPAGRVDWPRTEQYAESVRAAAYGASSGDKDFAEFSNDVAKVLNEVSRISDPGVRLATAERARRSLADWPGSHYGYRVGEVREALGVLDEVIAQLRVAVGQTRFDLSLSAPLASPPPPPLPAPSDAELVEQFVAAASLAETPGDKVTLLQTVLRLLDRAVGLLPPSWADRVRRGVTGDLEGEQRLEREYAALRKTALEASARAGRRGDARELERIRARVQKDDTRLGRQRPGEVAALLATIDLQASTATASRAAYDQWKKRAPAFRRYRRAMRGSFSTFTDAARSLEQIRAMSGPAVHTIGPLAKRLARASRNLAKVTPPPELAAGHALVRSAWELAESALRLRLESVGDNSIDGARRASSAAAGALMLYTRARADLTAAMESPSPR